MKLVKLLSLALVVAFFAGCEKEPQEKSLPDGTDITADFDPQFAARLEEKGYIPDAGKILYADVKDITEVDVSGSVDASEEEMLTSVAGIEHFKALQTLNCNFNQISAIDISRNTALEKLSLHFNKLTEIDVSKNTALTTLHCNDNQLATIDISRNTALEELMCSDNKLTNLDVRGNGALTSLRCFMNELTNLDISENKALNTLDCAYSK